MSLSDPALRRDLLIGAAIAAALLLASASLPVPGPAASAFIGLWVALQARPSRAAPCTRRSS